MVGAVGGSEVDDESELRGRVLDVLLLEGAFLGLIGPRQALVEIKAEVKRGGEGDDAPTNRSPHDPRNGQHPFRGKIWGEHGGG